MKRFIFSVLAVVLVMSASAYGADLPVSYDLRTLGRVTPARDQEWLGTCWAFGVFGAVESNYLTKYVSNDSSVSTARTVLGGVKSADLSELHLAWYLRNDPDKRKRNTTVMPRTVTINSLNGAYTLEAAAELTRLDGPVLESSLPYLSTALLGRMGFASKVLNQWYSTEQYPTYNFLQSLAESQSKDLIASGDHYPILPGLTQSPKEYGVKLRLTDILFSSQTPVRLTTESNDKRDRLIPEKAKELIMKHGALAIAYHSGNSGFNKYENSYYYSGGEANHAVVITGWDDNYSADKFTWHTKPSSNGAWIVKNSWGTDWAESGDFYMSYQQPILEGAAFIVEDLPADLKVYQHDPLGWCDVYGASFDTLYAANVFKADSAGEKLEGISFYTTEAGATVEWQVFYNLGANKPTLAPYTAGAVSISGSETFPYSGYHTIKLADKNISLTQGTYFAVVLKVTNPNAKHPLVVERKIEKTSDFAAVHDYESWFSEDGLNWWDGINTLNGKKSTPMNACIKAFTIGGTGTEPQPDKMTILGRNLDDYMNAASVKNAQSSKDVKPNSNIPDEPLIARVLFTPANASGDRLYSAGTNITYYLVNVTEAHEFVEAYEAAPDTTYPTGFSPYNPDREYDPLFEEGYEPDVFWLAGDGGEYPVYGPFITSVDEDGFVYLDVQNLEYGNESGDLGSIPKGYYDFVYMGSQGENGFVGSVELRLAASDFSGSDSDDITSPDVRYVYVSHDVIVVSREVEVRYVSHDVPVGIGSSSSGGCASGFGLAGLILVSGLASAMKKR